jgi:hypothetical protein
LSKYIQMKKAVVLIIAFISFSVYAQNSNKRIQTIQQDAWIQGLSSTSDTMGVPVKIVNFMRPRPNMHLMSLILQTTPEMQSVLRHHSAAKSVIPKLKLVVRTDTKSKSDEACYFSKARIVSVQPAKWQQGSLVVSVSYNDFAIVCGVQLNPGPPPGSLPVQDTGTNPGWICEESIFGTISRKEQEIVDFTSFYFDSQLIVTFGKTTSEVQQIFQAPKVIRKLILVLPDKGLHRYVEFKLWDVKATAVPGDGFKIVFKANRMECLMGE